MPILYKDSAQPTKVRVEDLLKRMTLEEKAAQLCGDLPVFALNGTIDYKLLKEKYPHGHGRFTQFSTLGMDSPHIIAHLANEIQRYFIEETRLGIPVVFQAENLCGYPAAGGTLFPSMTNLAATWMPELAEKMARIIGEETRAVGITAAMSPVLDVSRDPRWGRTYETFGEDPYLISQMGIRYIRGMQGEKADGAACIAKHFLGYSETQGGINAAVTRITDRELYEVFATPFEAAAKEADLSAMMASYSEIDGLPVSMNPRISRKLLRETMGFKGMLISDGAAVMKLYNYYNVAESYEQAGLLAKKAGLDTEIPVGGAFCQLPKFVRSGELDEELLDESVRRVLTIKFEYGLFEHPYLDEEAVAPHMSTPAKKAVSNSIAEKSLVLLKNKDNILPLKKGSRIAVIGPHADSLRNPVSGYTYPAYLEMLAAGRSGRRTTFNGIEDEADKAKKENKGNPYHIGENHSEVNSVEQQVISVLRDMNGTTLREELEQRYQVRYAQGCGVIDTDTSYIEEAVQAARESDVAVLAVGGNCGWVGTSGGEGKDRSQLSLPGVQQQLLEAVVSTGTPVVLILYGPGIFSLPCAVGQVSAIIQAWMPGVDAGRAVAHVLSGEVNPGGKLPLTIPRSVGQIPITYNHRKGSGYTSEKDPTSKGILAGGYVDDEYSPLFPFGFGLSYTSFQLSGFKIDQEEISTNGMVQLSCDVKNTGIRAGDETIQVYTRFRGAHVVRPVKQLVGFKRVELDPNEKATVTFSVQCAQLGYYNENFDFVVEPGILDIMVGTSSENILFSKSINLTGPVLSVHNKRVYTSVADVK